MNYLSLFIFALFASFTARANSDFHFDFKEANGKREIADSLGNHKCVSSVPMAVEDGALHINYGAKVLIPSEETADLSRPFTLNVWVLISEKGSFGTQPYNPILSKGWYNGAMEFGLAIQNHLPVLYYSDPTNKTFEGIIPIGHVHGATTRYANPDWVKDEVDVPNNVWTLLTVVRDQSEFRIYKNGKLVLQASPPMAHRGASAEPLAIGAERWKGEADNRSTAHMLINDLRLSSQVMDDASIREAYEKEKARYPLHEILLKAISDYFPEGMREFSYDLETELRIVQEYEKNLPAPPPPEHASMGSSIRNSGLLIDQERTFPISAYPNLGLLGDQSVRQSERYVKDFAAADVPLVNVIFGHPDVFWKGEDQFDWGKVNETFGKILSANPNAKILTGIFLTPPSWFIQKYPDELEKYYYNDEKLSAGLRTWKNSAPFASAKWRDYSCRALSAFIKNTESQPYANRVYGYHVMSGDAAEWYWPASFAGGLPGYSQATSDGFRQWLEKKYIKPEALASAWRSEITRFDQVQVPSPQERKAAERWIFRDIKHARKVFDFRDFMKEKTTTLLKKSVTTAKEASQKKKVISTYYGYPLLFAGKGMTLLKGGIHDLGSVLSLDSLDIVVTPVDYVHRRGGEPGMNINAFAASARLNNKMVWREEDLRTHFWPRFEYGRTSNTAESLGVILRDCGHAITNEGTGLWFMAMAGNAAFHQNAMMETIKKISNVTKESLADDRRSVAEMALVFDENSLNYLSSKAGSFIDDHCWGTYENASRMGAPFDVYLLGDLGKMRDYKVYVFLNAYAIDDAAMQRIHAKVRKNNAVAVWCYAPGYITQRGFSAKAMGNLTGIELADELREERLALEPQDREHPIMKYARDFPAYTFGPLFYASDARANTLATVDDKPALAVREVTGNSPAESWRSIYSLMPLTKELLMGICDYAGVQVYNRSFDVLSANNSYLMLHAVKGGTKHFELPEKRDVYNAMTGEKIATDTDAFSDPVPEKETRIYRTIRK